MTDTPKAKSTDLNGAEHLVEALKKLGTRTIFSLSGNQIMPVYDALFGSGIRLIHTRHESAAVYMAEAYAQLTDEVGIALITAGPGFANGLSAMYSARESHTPLIVMTGDAPLKLAGYGAFQEMDQQTAAGALAKASYRIERAADMFDAISNAAALACDGTPGPIHISLPDDVLREVAERSGVGSNVPNVAEFGSSQQAALGLGDAIIEQIKAAKHPLILAGPSFARPAWQSQLSTFSEKTGIPVLALESPRGLKAPRIGAVGDVLSETDLVVLLSLQPNFMLGFGQAQVFSESTKFICFSDDTDAMKEATRRMGADRLTTVAMSGKVALENLSNGEATTKISQNASDAGWKQRVDEAVAWRPPEWADLATDQPPFHAASVAREVSRFLKAHPETALIIDGGEVGQWCQAVLEVPHNVINGPSGAIGGSIPYAIAAKAARPDQPAIAMLGDGTAGFHYMEFETALRENLGMIAIVGNDAKWNAEHQIQMRDYGENRTHSCEMVPTRYDEIAKAMGCYGENVTKLSELVPAIERAISSGKPACINIEIQSIAAPVISRS